MPSAGTENEPAAAMPQASTNVPAPSLAEIVARISSFQQQAPPAPAIQWPFTVPASNETQLESNAQHLDTKGTPAPSPSSPPSSNATAVSEHAPPTKNPHADRARLALSTGASSSDAPNAPLAKNEMRAEIPVSPSPLSARVEEAAQNAVVPQQRVGLIPLMVGQEAMPAWVQVEWLPVNDRDGRGGQEKDQQALMVSVHIAGETLGRVAFHLAWLPKELAGTIVMEKPEALRAAQEELPNLETRLAEAGLPPPRLRLLRHASVPWEEETQEIDRT
jgi:hypothetical protein